MARANWHCDMLAVVVALIAGVGASGAVASDWRDAVAHWHEAVDGYWHDAERWLILLDYPEPSEEPEPDYPDRDRPLTGHRYRVFITPASDDPFTVTLRSRSIDIQELILGPTAHLDLHDTSNARLRIHDRAVIDGTMTIRDGRLNGDVAPLDLTGSGTIMLGGPRQNTAYLGNLRIDQGLTVRADNWGRLWAVENHGLVSAESTTGKELSMSGISGSTITSFNYGTIQAINGGGLDIEMTVNHGLIDVQAGSRLQLGQMFTNLGTVRANEAEVKFVNEHRFADLGTFDITDSNVFFTGTLRNTGATAQLNSSTGSWQLTAGARVEGGTLTTADDATWIVNNHPYLSSNTFLYSVFFDDVTLDGRLEVHGGTAMTVTDRLTLGNDASLALRTDLHLSELRFSHANGVLDGTGEIVLDGHLPFRAVIRPREVGSIFTTPRTLTIAEGVTIRTGDGSGSVGGMFSTTGTKGGHIINHGTLSAETPGHELHAGYQLVDDRLSFTNEGVMRVLNDSTLRLQGNWTNAGTIELASGILELDGPFTTADLGVIHRSGGQIILDGHWKNHGQTTVLDEMLGSVRVRTASAGLVDNGWIEGGRIESSGDAVLYAMINDVVRLRDVEIAAPIDLGKQAVVEIVGNVTLDDVDLTFRPGHLNAYLLRLDGGHLQGSSHVRFMPGDDGYFGRMVIRSGGPSSLGGGVTVTGEAGDLEIRLHNTLTNHGLIEFEQAGHTLGIAGGPWSSTTGGVTTIHWHDFINEGVMRVANNATLDLQADWHNPGTIQATDAHLVLGGLYRTSDLAGLHRTGGTVTMTGEQDMQNATFLLDSLLGPWNIDGGRFVDGRLAVDYPSRLNIVPGGGIGFRNATIDQSVQLAIANGQALDIQDTLYLQGKVSLDGGRVTGDTLDTTNGTFEFNEGQVDIAAVTGDLTNSGGRLVVAGAHPAMNITGHYQQHRNGTLQVHDLHNHPLLEVQQSVLLDGVLDLTALPRDYREHNPARHSFEYPVTLIAGQNVLGRFNRVDGVLHQSSPYAYAVTYTNDTVELRSALVGDIAMDGQVGLQDFAIWRDTFEIGGRNAEWSTGDVDGDGYADVRDFLLWYAIYKDAQDVAAMSELSAGEHPHFVYNLHTGELSVSSMTPLVAFLIEGPEAEQTFTDAAGEWLAAGLNGAEQWVDASLEGAIFHTWRVAQFAPGLDETAFGTVEYATNETIGIAHVQVIPEPGTLAMGLAGALLLLRRRRVNAASSDADGIMHQPGEAAQALRPAPLRTSPDAIPARCVARR